MSFVDPLVLAKVEIAMISGRISDNLVYFTVRDQNKRLFERVVFGNCPLL